MLAQYQGTDIPPTRQAARRRGQKASRAAMTGLLSAAKEVRERGTFSYIDTSLATLDMNAFLRE
jgi:hypothetical protein